MNGLRVIAGTARGRKLFGVPGKITRPITDRVKEALFNIIGGDIKNATVLDLFAGTGSVGIEALSRGADFVRFVDIHRLAIKTINTNLSNIGFNDQAEVVQQDAFVHLTGKIDKSFDYLYIAPPQNKNLWAGAVESVGAHPDWLVHDAWVIAQIHPVEYRELKPENLEEFDLRKYGSTALVFYHHQKLISGLR